MGTPDGVTDVPGLDQAVVDEMITARRHLHAHPDLSNKERETQAFISNWLCERGLAPRPVAGAGFAVDVVGTAIAASTRSRKSSDSAFDIRAEPPAPAGGLNQINTDLGIPHDSLSWDVAPATIFS